MSSKEILIFFTILVAMSSIAIIEAYHEGEDGYSNWWKIDFGKYSYSAYHIWMYWIMIPFVIIVLPLAVADFSWRLFWLLIMSYLIGTIFEDFLWYLANPKVSLKKWNPNDTYWYPWLKIGFFALPWPYIIKGTAALIIWLFLF